MKLYYTKEEIEKKFLWDKNFLRREYIVIDELNPLFFMAIHNDVKNYYHNKMIRLKYLKVNVRYNEHVTEKEHNIYLWILDGHIKEVLDLLGVAN